LFLVFPYFSFLRRALD